MNIIERFIEQCITDCIEGNGPDADLHRLARAQKQQASAKQTCNAPECCCDKCWAQVKAEVKS